MYRQRIKQVIYGIILLSLIPYMVGCEHTSLQDIITSQLPNDYIDTFYGEGVQTQYIQGEEMQSVYFTEWKGNEGSYRLDAKMHFNKEAYELYSGIKSDEDIQTVELKCVYNRDQLIIYYPNQDEYAIREISLEDSVEDSIIQGIDTLVIDGSPKAYTTSIVTRLSEAYQLRIEDDVRVNGKLTQHIIATGKNEGNKNQRLEYWVDQENWLIIKSYEQIGNYAIGFEYQKMKINPPIKPEIFTEEVKAKDQDSIIYLGDNLEKVNKTVSLEEAIRYLETPILYLEQGENIELKRVQYIESIFQAEGIVRLTYEILGENILTIENTPYSNIYSCIDLGGEKIPIGDYNATYYEFEGSKMIQIINSDVICMISTTHEEISRGELIAIVSKLVSTGK